MILDREKMIILLSIFITIITTASILLAEHLNDNKLKDKNEDYYKEIINYIYNDNPEYLNFINNKAIYQISELKKGYKGTEFSILTVNEDFEECTGFIIITKKEDQSIEINTSKICDHSND